MAGIHIVDGKPTTRLKQWLTGLGLAGTGMLWLGCFLVGPLAAIAVLAFAQRGDYGELIWEFSTENFWRMIGYTSFGWTPDHLWILLRSTVLAGVTTLLCLVLGFPLAFWVAARSDRTRTLMLAVVMLPTCINLVIRTYAWQLLLGAHAPPAWIAAWCGLIPEGGSLYPSAGAVYLGMVSAMLPFAALPLYTSVERLDWSIIEASRDLYAGRWATFRHGVLPQVMPGLVAATILTAIPSLGMFVVSDLLGGAKYMLIGNLIQQQFGAASDWPFGAMLGLTLIVATLVSLAVLIRWGQREGGQVR
jgi:spermidine/putrescine transport system permease protein